MEDLKLTHFVIKNRLVKICLFRNQSNILLFIVVLWTENKSRELCRTCHKWPVLTADIGVLLEFYAQDQTRFLLIFLPWCSCWNLTR